MKTNYTKQGTNNSIIVLLHGWGESKETWKDVIPFLSENYTVYALDLPAFGDNQKGYTIFALEDYTAYVNEFFGEHKIESSILIGHSFGGRVATLFTLQHPKRVDKLVIYSSNIQFIKRPWGNFNALKSVNNNMVLLFSLITRGMKNKKIVVQDYVQLSKIQRRIHTGTEFIDILHQIKQPVLLIAGRFDLLTTLSYQKNLTKQFINAKLVIFNRSTHIAHREEKSKFIRIIMKYIIE